MKKILISLLLVAILGVKGYSQVKDTTVVPKIESTKSVDTLYYRLFTKAEVQFIIQAIKSLDEKPSLVAEYVNWFTSGIQGVVKTDSTGKAPPIKPKK